MKVLNQNKGCLTIMAESIIRPDQEIRAITLAHAHAPANCFTRVIIARADEISTKLISLLIPEGTHAIQ